MTNQQPPLARDEISKIVDSLPPPDEIRRQIDHHAHEIKLLRKLLRLSGMKVPLNPAPAEEAAHA